MNSIRINIEKAKNFYQKILGIYIENTKTKDDEPIIVAESLRELSKRIDMPFKTVRNYVNVFNKLGIIHIYNSKPREPKYSVSVDVCDIVKAHFLFDLSKKICSAIDKEPLLSYLLNLECNLDKYYDKLTSEWSIIDDLFVLSFYVHKKLSNYGIKLRSLGSEIERLTDLFNYSPRIKELVDQLCRWYLGEPIIVDYIAKESKDIDVSNVFLRILNKVTFEEIRFKPLWRIFKQYKTIDVNRDWRETLDLNLYILVYHSLKKVSFRSVKKSKWSKCILKYYGYVRDTISVLVGLAINFSSIVKQ